MQILKSIGLLLIKEIKRWKDTFFHFGLKKTKRKPEAYAYFPQSIWEGYQCPIDVVGEECTWKIPSSNRNCSHPFPYELWKRYKVFRMNKHTSFNEYHKNEDRWVWMIAQILPFFASSRQSLFVVLVFKLILVNSPKKEREFWNQLDILSLINEPSSTGCLKFGNLFESYKENGCT